MAAALRAAAVSTSIAAVRSCFAGGSDSATQLLASPSSVSVAGIREQYPSVRCGRGDKRTAKGKRFKGSFGNARPRKSNKSRGLGITPLPPRPPKQEIEKDDFIQVDIDESLFSG
ncbi:unnamed protein product [Calypogeia fissa]